MEVVCFLANVRKCNIARSVVHVEHCFQVLFVYYYISLFLAGQGGASGWFVRMELTNKCTPNSSDYV